MNSPGAPAARAALLLLPLVAGCSGPPEPQQTVSAAPAAISIAGPWRGVLHSPGGELPFGIEFTATADQGYSAVIINGAERAPTSGVGLVGRQVVINFNWYDAELSARLSDDGARLTGRWRKTASEGESILPFTATRGAAKRFPDAQPTAADMSVAGVWSVQFTDDDEQFPATGRFVQQGNRVTGTFLTTTGDYRYLDGVVTGDTLRLSTFDGAHAFLFTATRQPDGTLRGDFHSRDSYHATWVARQDAGATLPDAWTALAPSSDEGRFRFSFEDLDGNVVADTDARFAGKVRLIVLFGTWCPNCNDEAPVLVDLHRRYREQGLEVVGLAFEYTGDAIRDREMLSRYRDRYGIEYPLLLAGTSDKQDAAAVLPDVDQVLAYPTTIFVDRNGQVAAIHSGFSGPGTGADYTTLIADMETRVRDLLAQAPESGLRGS